MTITTMRRTWPAERYQQFLALRRRARDLGLSIAVGNYGPVGMPMFSLQFSRGQAVLGKEFDIEKATSWLDRYDQRHDPVAE